MGETIAILVIFFFLIIFGFSFYVRLQGTTIATMEKENADLKSIQIAQKASFLPELQCSSKNVQTDNCFDLIKIYAFSKLLNNTEADFYHYYYDVFGYTNISIKKVYPPGKEYNLYLPNVTGRGAYKLYRVPVSLYNATSRTYSFGVLSVRYYG